MNCTVCGAAEEHFSGEECVETLKSKLEATEKERLDLLARVGYAEGAGEEGLRRWELAEERARAAESRLDTNRKAMTLALNMLHGHCAQWFEHQPNDGAELMTAIDALTDALGSGAATDGAELSNESSGPHSEPVVEKHGQNSDG